MEKEIICTEKHIVYLALGSNIGDKIKNLTSAIEEINNFQFFVISLDQYTQQFFVGDLAHFFLSPPCFIGFIG